MVDYWKTGSGELPNAIFIDGQKAHDNYGVAVRSYAGPCPNCKVPIDVILSFNPTDSGYYICFCPSCLKIIRYCDFDGNLSDFAIMTSQKTTPLDIDQDIPLQYGPSY